MITGAAQGIGLAIATVFAEEGAGLLLLDRNGDGLDAAVPGLDKAGDGAIECAVVDVGVKAEVVDAVSRAERSLGPIDILVNNAGIWVIKPFLDNTDEDFHRTITTNLYGTWYCMKAVLPGMVERRHGHVVNLASAAAFGYTVPHSPYAASKAAVAALTRDVAFEVAEYGVRVNAIAPGGGVHRGGERVLPSKSRPMGMADASDIASVVRFLCSDDSRFITGVTVPVAGGADLAIGLGWTAGG